MKDRVKNIFVLLITIGFLLVCLSPASAQGPICPSGYQKEGKGHIPYYSIPLLLLLNSTSLRPFR
jgi:hypothetical protein